MLKRRGMIAENATTQHVAVADPARAGIPEPDRPHAVKSSLRADPPPIRMANTRAESCRPMRVRWGKAVTAFQAAEIRERLLRSHGTAQITDAYDLRHRPAARHVSGRTGTRRTGARDTADAACFGTPMDLGVVVVLIQPQVTGLRQLEPQDAARHVASEYRERC
jgi:hypothetical protein